VGVVRVRWTLSCVDVVMCGRGHECGHGPCQVDVVMCGRGHVCGRGLCQVDVPVIVKMRKQLHNLTLDMDAVKTK